MVIRQDLAACRSVADVEMFFPAPGDRAQEEQAKRVCAGCPVRLECLMLALRTKHLDGVWGGMTAAERARYTRETRTSLR